MITLPDSASHFVKCMRDSNVVLDQALVAHRHFTQHFGPTSRTIRRELRIKHWWMAQKLGVGISTMRSLERGRTPWTDQYLLAWEKAILEHLSGSEIRYPNPRTAKKP